MSALTTLRMRFVALLIVGLVITALGVLTLFYPYPKPPSRETDVRNIVIEFLKTTDVSGVLMEDTVTIEEVYDHRLGGDIVVARYTTSSMGHPEFMLEALEDHIAAFTLSSNDEVVSAFCIHGEGVFWDLVNRKWFRT